VGLGPPERAELEKAIIALNASGGTQLYDAVAFAYDKLQSQADNDRINVILVMTDGQSEGSISVVESRLGKETFPVLIFTVGYGEDADFSVLQRIARLGEGRAYPSDLDTIGTLYELLSAYF
ncbi:MAG: vWA domain-containing protein, partial [Dehalococcoidia bacterium]